MISGTELYRYQTGVNYKKMRDIPALRFVYAKATQGTHWVDPMFSFHRVGVMDDAGKDFGSLHFLDYNNYERGQEIAFGRLQAEFHWSIIEKRPGNLPDCCDCETNEGAQWGAFNYLSAPRILKIALAYHVRIRELSGQFGIDYVLGWATDFMRNFLEGGLFAPRYKLIQATKDTFANGVWYKAGQWYQPPIDHFLTDAELLSYPKPKAGLFREPLITQYASTLSGKMFDFDGNVDADFVKDETTYALLKRKAVGAGPAVIPPPHEDGPEIIVMTVINTGSLGLKVRTSPSTSSAKLQPNNLPNGSKVNTVERIQDGADVWRKRLEGGYCAELYDGERYLK